MARTTSKKKGTGTGLNLIDFVVILLVVICLFGAVVRVGQVDWFAKSSDLSEYEVYFSINNIAYTSEDALVVGDTFTLVNEQVTLGTLKSVDSVLPSAFYVKDAEGNVLSVNYPESNRIDVTGTVNSLGKMTENGFLLGGTVYIAPGKTYLVQSEHMDFTLNILDIEDN